MSPLEPEEEAIEADEGALPSQEQTRELGPDLGLRHRAGSSDGISGMKAAESVCMWFAGTATTLSKQHALKGKNCVTAFEDVASAEELQFLKAPGDFFLVKAANNFDLGDLADLEKFMRAVLNGQEQIAKAEANVKKSAAPAKKPAPAKRRLEPELATKFNGVKHFRQAVDKIEKRAANVPQLEL